ncbi:MAG: GNAT family N-acetyltransferase [Candidatus Paceibacterota bacterium]|jgi:ribosomal protein S18 acetylase RimI-like enzyme
MEETPRNNIEGREIRFTKRKATEADREFVRRTHHAAYYGVVMRQFGSFDEKAQNGYFADSWKPEHHEILLNEAGQEVGYCSIERFHDHIRIHELVIAPEFQGRGVGTKVLQDVLEESRAKKIPVTLQVLKENEARHLYRKVGFKDAGETDTHIQMEFNPQ